MTIDLFRRKRAFGVPNRQAASGRHLPDEAASEVPLPLFVVHKGDVHEIPSVVCTAFEYPLDTRVTVVYDFRHAARVACEKPCRIAERGFLLN